MATWLFLKLHFHRANGSAIGPGRAAILEAIDRFGSLTSAAAALGITYRQVWNVVQTINTDFEGLVEVKRGRHGGGAVLTPKARALLAVFREIEGKFYDVFADDLKRMEEILGEDPNSPQPIPRDVQIIDPKLLPRQESAAEARSAQGALKKAKGKPAKDNTGESKADQGETAPEEETSPRKRRAKAAAKPPQDAPRLPPATPARKKARKTS